MSIPPPAAMVPANFPQLRSRPSASSVMPFLLSLLLHATVVVLGVAALHAVRTVVRAVTREQIIVPEMGAMAADPTAGSLAAGVTDANRPTAQQDFPDVKEATGLSNQPSHDLSAALKGGEAGDATMAIGPGAARSTGSPGGRHGEGENTGGLAPFGVPGGDGALRGGGGFIHTPFGNARRIVFVCDASGSMMQSFDLLRVELRKAVDSLRPPQAFNVLFFQENAKPPLARQLLFVTPENKRLAFEYVDKIAARGTTDPLPALKLALEMKPELMYFLIDPSDFPDKPAVLELFRKANIDKQMKLNTIAFIGRDPEDEAFLKQLAMENGGVFRYVSEDELGR